MLKLIKGLHHFQSEVFLSQKELFERLAHKQTPDALFITCADSRINPNLITQTDPGEIFVLRNAGNIIPPHGASMGGEAATIEFAITKLGIKDIIICGHSQCGAMSALLNPEGLDKMPAVCEFLKNADATRRIVLENYQDLTFEEQLAVCIKENVLVQLENLRTHPAVAAALGRQALNLHGWVYKIAEGKVLSYLPATGQFSSAIEVDPPDRKHANKPPTIVPI